jgi:hypothetical protein
MSSCLLLSATPERATPSMAQRTPRRIGHGLRSSRRTRFRCDVIVASTASEFSRPEVRWSTLAAAKVRSGARYHRFERTMT